MRISSKKLINLISSLIWVQSVVGDIMSTRFLQGCEILDIENKIVCFGGTSGSVDIWNQFNPNKDFYSLDVTQALSPSQAKISWKPMPPPSNSFILEPRAEFAHAVVNNSKWMIFSGAGSGNNYTNPTLVNVSVAYDSTTNEWSTYKSSTVPLNFENDAVGIINYTFSAAFKQMQGVSACSRNKNGTNITPLLIIGGGLGLSNTSLIDPKITPDYEMVFAADPKWTQMEVYGLDRPNLFFRTFREQCALTSKAEYFAFGGFGYNLTTDAPYYTGKDNPNYAMNLIGTSFFDFKYATFNKTRIDNYIFNPTKRYWHTLTPLPTANKILMYGGVFDNAVSRDYCLLYDTDTSLWSIVTFENEATGPGPRYGHSAVLVGNETLYIINGADVNHQLTNEVHILNITSMTWLNATSNSTWSPVSAIDNSSQSSSLSGGAIAGIVVGSVAGASLLIAGAVLFVCLRKRKQAIENDGKLAEVPEFPHIDLPTQIVLDNEKDNNNRYSVKPSSPLEAAQSPLLHDQQTLFTKTTDDGQWTVLTKPSEGDATVLTQKPTVTEEHHTIKPTLHDSNLMSKPDGTH